jgi:hypothetical protein
MVDWLYVADRVKSPDNEHGRFALLGPHGHQCIILEKGNSHDEFYP